MEVKRDFQRWNSIRDLLHRPEWNRLAIPRGIAHYSAMEKLRDSTLTDNALAAAKRERQAQARAQVADGRRTQESMFLLSSAVVKATTVRHRVLSFG